MRQKLAPNQVKALAVLIDGGNDSEAAEAAGVRRQTVNTWKNKPEFQDEFDKQYAEIIPKATAALTASIGDCVSYLRSVVVDDEKSDTVRIRAASTLLTNAIRYTETSEIVQRLEEVEAIQRGGG